MNKRKLIVLAVGAGLLCLTILPPVRSSVTETYEQIKLIVDVLQHINEHYVEEVNQSSLVYGAAAGMVRTLDPFSQFMEPEVHKEMKTETSGQFGGVGLRIAVR